MPPGISGSATFPIAARFLSQEPRFGSPFKGKIFEMIWRNGQYEPETPVTVSTAVNVLGLTIGQIVKGQRETIAAYDPNDHIRVFDEAGKEESKSAEVYGGSTLHTLGNIDDQGQTERPIYLPMRLMALKPDKDGKSQVLAVRNFVIAGRKAEVFRVFNEAQIIGFGWDGLGLQPEWRTRKATGGSSAPAAPKSAPSWKKRSAAPRRERSGRSTPGFSASRARSF